MAFYDYLPHHYSPLFIYRISHLTSSKTPSELDVVLPVVVANESLDRYIILQTPTLLP